MATKDSLSVSHINNIELAAQEEEKGNVDQAIKYYEAAIKDERADEFPFNRLMILYRKEKKYKDELRVINKGIRLFTDSYKKSSTKVGRGKKLSDLSEAFMKTSGLKDRKGNLLYQPEPIGKWTKRKQVVEKKIK
jgi:tetratricopeptide (TPR) repeat protein